MSLEPGARLGPYEIVGPLGVGGMGKIYKARDTRLDRLVAIKRSTGEFSDRFEREARAIGALNHPNICQLYDVGPDYLVMELVEGRPLAPDDGMRKVLDLAVQIADGMAAAHAAGIVHRDLKPDNILVTPEGRVKILDFGIAKALATDANDEATRTSLTGAGKAIGTVQYMSPEQARGLTTIGPQSDQFSFGLILYELAAGRKAFARESSAETLTAIIREDAAPLPATVPAPLRWIIERLLAKDPGDRYDSSRDLYRELRQIRERPSDATTVTSGMTAATRSVAAAGTRTWVAAVAAVTLAAAAAGVTWAVASRTPAAATDLSAYRFSPVSLEVHSERGPTWSPDGQSVAYRAVIDGVAQLMVRDVATNTPVRLTNETQDVVGVSWAPDGTRLYYVRAGAGLYSVSAVGGEPELVIDDARSAAVHPGDGRIAFERRGGLWTVDPRSAADARAAQPLGQTPFEGNVALGSFSPDGTKLAVLKDRAVWVLAYPSGVARQVNLNQPILDATTWMPDNRRVFVRPNADPDGSHGLALVDTERATIRTVFKSPTPLLNPSVSPDGRRLAFVTGDTRWKLLEVTLADGRVRELGTGARESLFPSLSPDGTRLAYTDGTHPIIREMTLAAAGETVRTIVRAAEGAGTFLNDVLWSPDGARILFMSIDPGGRSRLVMVPGEGGRLLPVDPAAIYSGDGVWSPSGSEIAYMRSIDRESQLVIMRVGTSGAPVVLRRWKPEDGDRARLPVAWAPDGRSIVTRNGGQLFVMAVDGSSERPLTPPGEVMVTGRAVAVFSADGRELKFIRRDPSTPGRLWRLFAIDVASGRQRVVATLHFPTTAGDHAGLSFSPDGRRLYTSISDWPLDIWMVEGFQ
jgi:Tol biopolymer transport system component/tRNA A-37 threonylcarbamoyl transferase component Bud32